MKLIKLTSLKSGDAVYVNIDKIGHIYAVGETVEYGSVKTPAHTVVGVDTHNNGGFMVRETIDEILLAISSLRKSQISSPGRHQFP